LHYSAQSRSRAAFVDDLEQVHWARRIHFHFSDAKGRIDLVRAIGPWSVGHHLYTCGSARYMQAVFDVAAQLMWPDDHVHREYFAAPEAPERINHPFVLRLARSGASLAVAADQSAAQVLRDAGVHIELKCSDGICGVCAARLIAGDVDHRDYALGAAQRQDTILLCCSRARGPGAEIMIDL